MGRWLWPIAFIVALTGYISFFDFVIDVNAAKSYINVITEWFEHNIYSSQCLEYPAGSGNYPYFCTYTFIRVLFLIALMIIAIGVVRSLILRNHPISIISTNIDVALDNENPLKYLVHREQVLRANWPKVTSLRTSFSVEPGGKVTVSHVDAMTKNDRIQNNRDKSYIPGSSNECFHRFENGLPCPFYSALIPNFLLGWIRFEKLCWPLSKCVIKRTMTNEHIEPGTSILPSFGLSAQRYIHRDVILKLRVPINGISSEELQQKIRILSIKDDAVTELSYIPKPLQSGGFEISRNFSKLKRELIRVEWPSDLY